MAEEKKLDKKNILIIIASRNFRDEEYFVTYEILQREGAEIVTASSIKGSIIGVKGGEARSTLSLKEVEVKDFDAVIFVGGSGAEEYFDNNEAHRIVHETVSQNKILAAICIAPVILAKAGVLKGKSATVWSSLTDESGKKELKSAGCTVSGKRVEKDGNIITADGPAVAEEFAVKIAESIIQKEKEDKSGE